MKNKQNNITTIIANIALVLTALCASGIIPTG